jgi:hypothetical protein
MAEAVGRIVVARLGHLFSGGQAVLQTMRVPLPVGVVVLHPARLIRAELVAEERYE